MTAEQSALHPILQRYIQEPDHFLNNLALAQSAYHDEIWLAEPRLILEHEGQKLLAVFSSLQHAENFKASLPDGQRFGWQQLTLVAAVELLEREGIEGLLFNPTTDDAAAFEKEDLVLFLNYHGHIIEKLLQQEELYFVPGIVLTGEDREPERHFETLQNPAGERYIPVFSQLNSLAAWYNQPDFGGDFRQRGGMIFPWSMSQFLHPKTGKHIFEGSKGIVLDAFAPENPTGTLRSWEDLND